MIMLCRDQSLPNWIEIRCLSPEILPDASPERLFLYTTAKGDVYDQVFLVHDPQRVLRSASCTCLCSRECRSWGPGLHIQTRQFSWTRTVLQAGRRSFRSQAYRY